jgi:AraC family transcriptional regulator
MNYSKKKKPVLKKLHVKNMVCNCCIHLIRKVLSLEGVEIHKVRLGYLAISYIPSVISWKKIETLLNEFGFEILEDKESVLLMQIKQAVIEMIHYSTFDAMVKNSDYLVGKFNISYPSISAIFSKREKMTLEKFIILQKIEKVKELIEYEELTLSEIAYMMGYSSVQYLSTQFKTVTGISVTDYKGAAVTSRKSLESI